MVVNWRDLDHSSAGGAERYAWEFALALRDSGFQVEFLTARDRGQSRRDVRSGIRVVRAGGPATFIPLALLRLARRRGRVELVIDADCGLPTFSPIVLSRRRTAVLLLVHHVHQAQFGSLPRPLALVARWLERGAMPRVYRNAQCVAVSESTRAEMIAQLGWVGPVTVIHNGTEVAPERRSEIPGERVVILGRLSRHKRVDLALRALAALSARRPHLVADVVGGGAELGELRVLAEELGIATRVRFHGRVDEAEKHRLLARADVHLCASDAEGWGQVVLEAAGHGVPTVARDVPGLRDSVRAGETGWLVSGAADEVDALAAAVDEALLQLVRPERRAEIDGRCRAWASGFSWAQMHREASAEASHAIARSASSSVRERPVR